MVYGDGKKQNTRRQRRGDAASLAKSARDFSTTFTFPSTCLVLYINVS